MSDIEWQDDFVDKFFAEVTEEARRRNFARGKAEGKAEEAVNFRITLITKVLNAYDLHPTEQQLARLAECTDIPTLDRWFDHAITADSADEVFQEEET